MVANLLFTLPELILSLGAIFLMLVAAWGDEKSTTLISVTVRGWVYSPPSLGSTRQWWRDTRASGRWTSLSSARPIVIVDPRAGPGPGIGGFKPDSQVGVSLRAGHPVYFVAFSPEPVPSQTIADVAWAEARFLETVFARHPQAIRKPAVIGNAAVAALDRGSNSWGVSLSLRPDIAVKKNVCRELVASSSCPSMDLCMMGMRLMSSLYCSG
jgi:hypothetical protein